MLLNALIFLSSVAFASAYGVEFTVNLEPGKTGQFVVEVNDAWAPLGAARFRELVDQDFFKGVRFFRVVKGFMAQFGISGDPKIAAAWKEKKITDDAVKECTLLSLNCRLLFIYVSPRFSPPTFSVFS